MSDKHLDQIIAGIDVSDDRIELTIVGWPQLGEPYVMRTSNFANHGDERIPHMFPGERIRMSIVRLGHKERYLDVRLVDRPANVAICTRTTRRAARRARGRARADRRVSRRRHA